MCPDDGTVDHLQQIGLVAAVCERLQEHVPHTGDGPAAELPMDRIPVAEFLWQVSPSRAGSGNPKDAVQRATMILRWTAALCRPLQGTSFESRQPVPGNPASPICPRGPDQPNPWKTKMLQSLARKGTVSGTRSRSEPAAYPTWCQPKLIATKSFASCGTIGIMDGKSGPARSRLPASQGMEGWGALLGLMQDCPLLMHRVIDHAAQQHSQREVISRSVEKPIHQTNYAASRQRALRVACDGVRLGDRVASMAWNTSRRLEDPVIHTPPRPPQSPCRTRGGERPRSSCRDPILPRPRRRSSVSWRERSPKWWLPDDVAFVRELPHTATGKVDKKALRLLVHDRPSATAAKTSGRPESCPRPARVALPSPLLAGRGRHPRRRTPRSPARSGPRIARPIAGGASGG